LKPIKITSSKEWDVIDITEQVSEQLPEGSGIGLVYCPHTSAAVLVGEADATLVEDYERAAKTLLARARPFLHTMNGHLSGEGHVFSFLHGFEVMLPYENGRLTLAPLQHVFFVDTTGPRDRELWFYSLSR
jgi:secondary thiamine-phosphate synthase enzyme